MSSATSSRASDTPALFTGSRFGRPAGDLRFIAASFKVITDLELVADLATNLGDYTLDVMRDLYPDVDI